MEHYVTSGFLLSMLWNFESLNCLKWWKHTYILHLLFILQRMICKITRPLKRLCQTHSFDHGSIILGEGKLTQDRKAWTYTLRDKGGGVFSPTHESDDLKYKIPTWNDCHKPQI